MKKLKLYIFDAGLLASTIFLFSCSKSDTSTIVTPATFGVVISAAIIQMA